MKYSNASSLKGLMINPPQKSPCGKANRSTRVTIPKLLEPPFKACHNSGLDVAFALIISPDANTI